MDQDCIVRTNFVHELADGLQEWLALDITNRTTDFDDGNLSISGGVVAVKTTLDLIGNVGNYLYSAATVIATTLLRQNSPVNLTCGYIGIFSQTFINETLVVAKIQISFRTVIGNEHFAVLIRTHRAGVNIDIRIKLLNGDLIASGFQQATQRSRSDSLTQTGHNAAGDEYIFWHI